MATTATVEVIELDAHQLVSHPTNVRTDLGDLEELAASIAVHGILEPVVVVPVDDGHRILAGHRRTQASILAGRTTVPAIVRTDLTDAAGQVATMLTENIHRAALTTAEIAQGYQQLKMLGWTPAKIAKQTAAATAAEVKTALQVARSEVAVAVGHRHQLSLEHMAALAEFEHDREAVKALTVAAVENPRHFDHTLARIRRDKERKAEIETLRSEVLAAEGTVLTSFPGAPAAHLTALLAADDSPMTPEAHTGCPGHAGLVTEWSSSITWFCLDPATNGHDPDPTSARHKRPPTPEEEEAEAQRAANNEAWTAARHVCLDAVRALIRRRLGWRLGAGKARPDGEPGRGATTPISPPGRYSRPHRQGLRGLRPAREPASPDPDSTPSAPARRSHAP